MGIGKRISRIIKANVNDLLSAAEDPDKQLDLLIREMEDALRQAKQQLIRTIGDEKRLQHQLEESEQLTQLWTTRAQQAVDAGQDDLARQALRKKRTYEDLSTEYDQQLFEQQAAVDELREQYRRLEQRLEEARARRRRIAAELTRRQATSGGTRRAAARSIETGSLTRSSAFDKFDEMADKIEDMEAQVEAGREIEQALEPDDRLASDIDRATGRGARRQGQERDLEVDIELEEMRRRTGGRAPASRPPSTGEPERHARRSRSRTADELEVPPDIPEPPAEEEAPAEAAAPDEEQKPQERRSKRRDSDDDDDGGTGWGRRVEL